MKTVYYLRHGESVLNKEHPDRVNGRSNETQLTEDGALQAAAAGRWLLRNIAEPDILYVSPAVRTLQTLRHLLWVAGFEAPSRRDDRLQELSHGEYEGRLRKDVWTAEEVARLKQDPMNHRLPGGESIREVQSRMRAHLEEVFQTEAKTSLVIGHGLAIRALAGAIGGLSHQEIIFGLKTPNCSLTQIDCAEDGALSVVTVGRDIVAEQLAIEAEIG